MSNNITFSPTISPTLAPSLNPTFVPSLSPTFFGDCFEDEDCPGNKLCYSANFPWNNKSEGNVCDCNAWFGWTGEDCDEFGSGSYVFLTSIVFSGFVAVMGIILAVHTLFLLYRTNQKSTSKRSSVRNSTRNSRSNSKTRKFTDDPTVSTEITSRRVPVTPKKKTSVLNSVNVTSVLVLFAFVSYSLWRSALLVILLTPEEIAFREEDTIEGKAKAHFIEVDIEKYLVLVTGIFLCLSLLNLALVWIDNVKKIRTLTPSSESRVLKLSRFIIVLEFLWFFAFFFLPPAAQAGAVIFFMLISGIAYFLAVRYMRHLYLSLYGELPVKEKRRKSTQEQEEIEVQPKRTSVGGSSYWLEILLIRMTKARRRIVIGASIAIIGASVYLVLSISNSWREYSEPRRVSIPMVGNEMLSFGLGFCLLAVVIFLHDTANKPLRGK